MSGISVAELRQLVIRPALSAIGLGGEAAEELLLGTAAQESGCGIWLSQQGGGPALGIWQMEPKTHDDLWANFLGFRPALAEKLGRLLLPGLTKTEQLAGNLYYSCAMARVQYFRSAKSLPPAGDLEGQASFYKSCYNTPQGAASQDEYIANYKLLVRSA